MTKKAPEVYPFGHLHMILFSPCNPGAAWGVYANYEEKGLIRNPPLISGVIDKKTGKQLHRIAAAIDLMTREK